MENNKESVMNDLKDNNDYNCKRILCYNVINKKECTYGNKCMYAHSLSEQKIDTMRHKVYTILKNNNNLKDIDLINDKRLFKTFLELTKLCTSCVKKMCPGGYNCRNGAIHINFRICYDDMIYGYCRRTNCTSIHLTERGLIPYNQQKSKFSFGSQPLLDDKKNFNDSKRNKQNFNDITGVLLTEKFMMSHFGYSDYDTSESDSSDENVDDIIKYLNEDSSDEECGEDLFCCE